METAMRPTGESLAELGERYFRTQHTYDPYNATLLGLHDFDQLPGDPSREASIEAADSFAGIADELAAIDVSTLDEKDVLDHNVLTVLNRGAERDARDSLWAANASAKSYVSRQGLVFQTVPVMTITDDDGAERYLSRLDGIGDFLRSLGDRYVEEAKDGRTPTALGVDHAARQLDGYLALALDKDALLKPTIAYNDDVVTRRARAMVEDSIRPAMVELARRLRDDLLPVGRPDDMVGIRNIPGGEHGYIGAVARNTTTDLTPEQIHQIGLDTLGELRARWSEVGQGAIGESDFTVIAQRMRSDLSLRFESSEQIVKVAEDALMRAEAVQDQYFPHYEIPNCVVEQINPIDAENTALAYYRPPAVDGSRPGAHCLLASDPQSRFTFEYECLAFHESVPGHHLQLATAQTLDIPRYRKHLDVEACSFNEGWGLYSEQLAEEIGLYSSDLDILGMLSFSALRACRLVVDTGIHYYGWSREKAIDFMWENTATTKAHVRNEVDRYISWPGQALSYVIGKREILRLREGAKAALGGRFTLSGFHGAVLENGALPLSVLEQQIGRWQTKVAQGS
ncbi:DUF885 family protein [Homoserinimonas sp. OAct 916]|uniref:DUF885 domain-containing protein n=1 Tax=Homoserinimonas sp. OAct 916 TaxID=2211450 RepID=UPI001300ACDC|nr:DUF885 domain-containing protein [Homoserinimonas sp. OAct 916]